jgi:uncharacterized membrane protein
MKINWITVLLIVAVILFIGGIVFWFLMHPETWTAQNTTRGVL